MFTVYHANSWNSNCSNCNRMTTNVNIVLNSLISGNPRHIWLNLHCRASREEINANIDLLMPHNRLYANPHPLAQFRGVISWSCPQCESLHKTRITPGTFTLDCGTCERKWGFGLRFLKLSPGINRPPMDATFPEIAIYRSGGRANAVDELSDEER